MGIALLNFNSDHHIPTLRAVDSGRIMRAFDPPRSACLLSTLPQSDHHTLGPRRDASGKTEVSNGCATGSLGVTAVPVTPYNAVDQGHESILQSTKRRSVKGSKGCANSEFLGSSGYSYLQGRMIHAVVWTMLSLSGGQVTGQEHGPW